MARGVEGPEALAVVTDRVSEAAMRGVEVPERFGWGGSCDRRRIWVLTKDEKGEALGWTCTLWY